MNDPSPWMVNQLEDFLYFCCPECDTKEKDRESFLDHAFKEHPTTKVYLSIFTQPIEDDPILDNIKQEDQQEQNQHFNQNYVEDPEYLEEDQETFDEDPDYKIEEDYEEEPYVKLEENEEFPIPVKSKKAKNPSIHECDKCHKTFKTRQILHSHTKRFCHGKVLKAEDLECNKCWRVFSNMQGLSNHSKKCTGPDKLKVTI